MNFFFSILTNDLNSNLVIPRFKNNGECDQSYKVFYAKIHLDKWIIEEPDVDISEKYFKIK